MGVLAVFPLYYQRAGIVRSSLAVGSGVGDQRSTVSAQMLLNPSAGNEATFQPAWLRNYDVIPAAYHATVSS
jgi:hypothetical protein